MNQEAVNWIAGHDVGASSRCLWARMMGATAGTDHPHDPADIGRCFRLLEIAPEWKARLGEMRAASPYWAALVDRWDEIRSCMEAECGIAWEKGREAKKTYDLMKAILRPIEDKDSRYFRFSAGAGVRK